MDPLLGEIRMFAGNFAPRGWALCQGQLLSIAQNQALFSILGTTYGGNGQTTFALPDLRGRVPVGPGQGPGLAYVNPGESGGFPSTTLTVSQLPAHTHSASVNVPMSTSVGTSIEPGPNLVPAASNQRNAQYAPAGGVDATSTSATGTTGIAGGSQPISLMQPYLGINFIIAIQGVYPSRN